MIFFSYFLPRGDGKQLLKAGFQVPLVFGATLRCGLAPVMQQRVPRPQQGDHSEIFPRIMVAHRGPVVRALAAPAAARVFAGRSAVAAFAVPKKQGSFCQFPACSSQEVAAHCL